MEYRHIPSSTCYPSDSMITNGGYRTQASGYSMKPDRSSQRGNSIYNRHDVDNMDSADWNTLAQHPAEADMSLANSEVSLASTVFSSIRAMSVECVNPALYTARRLRKKSAEETKNPKVLKKAKSCVCADSLNIDVSKLNLNVSKKRVPKGDDYNVSKKMYPRADDESQLGSVINARDSVNGTKKKKKHHKKKSSLKKKSQSLDKVKSNLTKKGDSYESVQSHILKKSYSQDSTQYRCIDRSSMLNSSASRYGKQHQAKPYSKSSYAIKSSTNDSAQSGYAKKSYSNDISRERQRRKASPCDSMLCPKKCSQRDSTHSRYMNKCSYHDSMGSHHSKNRSYYDGMESHHSKPFSHHSSEDSRYPRKYYHDSLESRHRGRNSPQGSMASRYTQKSSYGSNDSSYPRKGSPIASIKASHSRKCCPHHSAETRCSSKHSVDNDLKMQYRKKYYVRDAGSIDSAIDRYKKRSFSQDSLHYNYAKKHSPYGSVLSGSSQDTTGGRKAKKYSDENLRSRCGKIARDCAKPHYARKRSPYDSLHPSYEEAGYTRDGGAPQQTRKYPPSDKAKPSQEKCCYRDSGSIPNSYDNLKSRCGKKARDCPNPNYWKNLSPYDPLVPSHEGTCCTRDGGESYPRKKYHPYEGVKPNQEEKCCNRPRGTASISDDNIKSGYRNKPRDYNSQYKKKELPYSGKERGYEDACCARHSRESHKTNRYSSNHSLKSGNSKCCSRHEHMRPLDGKKSYLDNSHMKSGRQASQMSVGSSAGRCYPCDNSRRTFESPHSRTCSHHDGHDSGFPQKYYNNDAVKSGKVKKKYSPNNSDSYCTGKYDQHGKTDPCPLKKESIHQDSKQPCCHKKESYQDNKQSNNKRTCCKKKCSHEDSKKLVCKKHCSHHDIGKPCCQKQCSHQDMGKCCCQKKCSHHDAGLPCCQKKCSHQNVGKPCCQKKCSHHDTKMPPQKKKSRQDIDKCSHHDPGQPCCRQKCSHQNSAKTCCQRKYSHQEVTESCCQKKCSHHDIKKPPKKRKSQQDIEKCSHHNAGMPCCHRKCSHHDLGQTCCDRKCSHQNMEEPYSQRKDSRHDMKKSTKRKQDNEKCSHHKVGQPCCHQKCSHQDTGEPCCQKKCSHHDVTKPTSKKKGTRNDNGQCRFQKKCSHHDAGQPCCQKNCSHQEVGMPCCKVMCPHHDDDEFSKKRKDNNKPDAECCYRKKPYSKGESGTRRSDDSISAHSFPPKNTNRESFDSDTEKISTPRQRPGPCLPKASCPDVSVEPCDSRSAVRPCAPKSCLQKTKSREQTKSEEGLQSCQCPKAKQKRSKQRKSVFQRLMASMAGGCSREHIDCDQQSSCNRRSRRDSMSGRDSVTSHRDSMTSTHSLNELQIPKPKVCRNRKTCCTRKVEDEKEGMSPFCKRPVCPKMEGTCVEKSLSPIKIESEVAEEKKEEIKEEKKEEEKVIEEKKEEEKKDDDTSESKEGSKKKKVKKVKKLKEKKVQRSECQCPLTEILVSQKDEKKDNTIDVGYISDIDTCCPINQPQPTRKCRRDTIDKSCLTKEQNALLHVLKRVSEYLNDTGSIGDCKCNPKPVPQRETCKRKTPCNSKKCYPHTPRPKEDDDEEDEEFQERRRSSADPRRHRDTRERERDEVDGCRRSSCITRKLNKHPNHNRHTDEKKRPCGIRHTDCKNYMKSRKTRNENEVVTKITDLTKKTSPCLCNSALFEKMLNKVMKEACFSPPAKCGTYFLTYLYF